MPKKVPMSEKREWLSDFDEGKPAAQIAKERKRALKVIKRGIEEARADRDGAAARAEIVKEAMIKHQQQLMGIIERLLEAAEIPPADLELRREKAGNVAPIPLSASRIEYTPSQGLIVDLPDENTALWGLLREHLTRDRLWSAIRNWKEAMISHMKARLDLESGIKTLIEVETGLKVMENEPADGETSFIYPHAVKLFYTVQIRKALGFPDGTNPQERIIAGVDGYVRHGEGDSKLAYCPGELDQCREALIRAFKKIADLPEIKRVTITESELRNVSNKLKRLLEDIRLMALIPGRCRICSRISL